MDAANDNLVQVKTCTKCGETKPVSDFYKHDVGIFGVRGDCKKCCLAAQKTRKQYPEVAERRREYQREWRNKNKSKVRGYQAKYYDENKEAIGARLADYFEREPERRKEVRQKSLKKSRSNPKRRLSDAIATGIRRGILLGSKNNRTFELLGYSPEQLCKHLERLFLPGMTWENYGKKGWHVDHVVPLSVFNYETPYDSDFKRAWALDNLQPLWEKDNLSKNAKLDKPFQPSLLLATNDNRKPPKKETKIG